MASYKARFVGTEDELKDLIGDESWLTAEECKAFGFCDVIEDQEEPEEPEEPENSVPIKVSLFEKYKVVAKGKDDIKNNLFDKLKGGKE